MPAEGVPDYLHVVASGEVDEPVRRGEVELARLRLQAPWLELVLGREAVELLADQLGQPRVVASPPPLGFPIGDEQPASVRPSMNAPLAAVIARDSQDNRLPNGV